MFRAIAAKDIDAWLAGLADTAEVLVPQRRPGGDVALAPLGRGERAGDYIRLDESPKRILLPQTDDLVRFEAGRGEPVLDQTQRILFGLRPCDAAAVAILDEFFAREYADPHYLARRKRMLLIVCACRRSGESCFCVSAGTGPVAAEGFDVQMFEIGGTWIAQAGTKAGEELIARGGRLFADPPKDVERRLDRFRRNAEDSQEVRLDLARARQIVREGAEPEGFWRSVAERCLMCGGCAYVCPTCACYDVADRPVGPGQGTRRRIWDTCILAGFTREAGGHNPRAEQPLRCSHRYQHKLSGSDSPARPFRCVGCGRCVDACLTRMGIITVLEELLEQTDSKKM